MLSGLVFSLNSSSYLQPVFAGGNNEHNNNNKNGEDETTTESTTSETELRTAMRELWVDHAVYTRQFIVDTVHDLPSLDQTTQRLLENQENIGDAIKPFYGEQAGDQLTNLLKEHILIAADVLSAAKAGDDEALADAQQRWSDNADEIAAFLADANPNWDEDELSDMLHEHLSLTTDEAVARLQGDYQADIEAFDKVVDQAMEMADTLSDGIIAQFPEKFDD